MSRLSFSLTRRTFLGGTGALAVSCALPRTLFAKTGGSARLVVVVLRGAMDGLAAAPPHGDPYYGEQRRDLAIAPPTESGGALALDELLGLHPSFTFLHDAYVARELIVFQAIASPYRDRSHFDGQAVLENGLGRPLGSADGWLNRALSTLPSTPGPIRAERAVAVSQNVPLILRGPAAVLSKSPAATPDIDADLLDRLADLYSKDDWFSARLSEAVQTERLGDAGEPMSPSAGGGRLAGVARMAATLMSSEGGPEIAVIDAGGWDTHANQGGAQGLLAQRFSGLDDALRTLSVGLGRLWSDTAVLVVTEFGRTVAVNGTRGTDHGTGGCAFLVGGAVQGGRVIADWPGLAHADLLDGRDLRPTHDLRSLFKAVLGEHMGINADALSTHVFPDSSGARPFSGLMRA